MSPAERWRAEGGARDRHAQKQINVRLDDELRARVDAAALSLGLTMVAFVRAAILEKLKRAK